MIRADADKLRQVFSNVIDNAIDSMASATERKLELSIRSNKSTGAAIVNIKDNGCGIPEDKLPKIFNPFYTSKSNGTGLGMAVAKKVVEAHRGRIEVQSSMGAGTDFEITVPLSDSTRSADDVQATASEQPRSEPHSAPATQNVGANPTMQLKV
jgi:signal transduction histidine kinase